MAPLKGARRYQDSRENEKKKRPREQEMKIFIFHVKRKKICFFRTHLPKIFMTLMILSLVT